MRVPPFLPPNAPVWFPDPREADEDGVVALGGDLSSERLLYAYEHGIFPWFEGGLPPIWWSPDPRAVILPEGLHVSRRLERRLRSGTFRFTWNHAFDAVISACAVERSDGTWITDEMHAAYVRLHTLGHAHSVEVWSGDDLVGGTYGIACGALFAAESKFHRQRDASKAAVVVLLRSLARCGVEVVDVQMMTSHLATMGAVEWSRETYLARLPALTRRAVNLRGIVPDWRPAPVGDT